MSDTAFKLIPIYPGTQPQVTAAHRSYLDALTALQAHARELDALGDPRYAEAVRADIEHYRRRCIQHLRRLRAENAQGKG